MMCLSWGMFIQSSVVHHSPGASIRFWSYHHPAAPGDRVIDWNTLQYTKSDISVKAFLDSIFPVKRDLAGTVNSNWLGIIINKYSERRTVLHQSEWLVFTTIKS